MLRAEADEDGAPYEPDHSPPGRTVIVTAIGYYPTASTAIVTASGRAELGT